MSKAHVIALARKDQYVCTLCVFCTVHGGLSLIGSSVCLKVTALSHKSPYGFVLSRVARLYRAEF